MIQALTLAATAAIAKALKTVIIKFLRVALN
jgi:hypothetical protein